LLRQQVGMVFQEPVVVAGSVRDNLIIRQRWEKSIKPLSDLDLLATLDKVGLLSIDLHIDARSLSGGEKQRLALARVLLNQPQVLLLDEPTASLDPTLARRIIQRVAELHREMNLTCIMVSHDPTLVRRFAERVVFLHEGQIAEDGPVAILNQPASAQLRAYLAEEQ
ncbi:MAG: ATP-binding cassette domain-containing protein, partial [Candidatus Marinimicrobia bacterium]|nr:ATP-binding cassette domain-containing protein [Candidatus Neomarinimicrobiota bacterium]